MTARLLPTGLSLQLILMKRSILQILPSGNYSLFIPGTAEDEGKLVTFKVDGKDAASSVSWKDGGIVTLELPDGKAVYTEIDDSNSDSNSTAIQ